MRVKILIAAAFIVMAGNVLAQGAAISDEDLRKYAIVIDSIDDMKQDLLADLGQMVKTKEGMTNARYNELSRIIDDEEQLQQAKATEEEISFIKEVQAKKDDGAAEISQTFQSLAKDYIGPDKYNQIKNALISDSALKARYDVIKQEVEKTDENK